MRPNRYLRKGSIVTIKLIPTDNTVVPGMLKYDGEKAAISRVCRSICRTSRQISPNGSAYGYELEGVVSDYGIPYTFIGDMIE